MTALADAQLVAISDLLGETECFGLLGLGKRASRLLGALIVCDVVSMDMAIDAIWFDAKKRPEKCEQSVGILLTQIKRALDAKAQVHNRRGEGWYLDPADKTILRDILGGANDVRIGNMVEQDSEYVIEQGIPIPGRNDSRIKYPFGKMVVGDSFLDRADGEDVDKVVSRLQGAAQAYRKKNEQSARFSIRKVDGGVRIWRTA